MARTTLLDKLRRMLTPRTAAREMRDNPVLKASVSCAAEIYGQTPLAELIDEQTQSALSRRLYLDLSEICNAREPRTRCRDKLVETMLRFAPFQVVMIPPPPTTDDSGLRELPGITGELQPRIEDLIEADTDLRTELEAYTEDQDTDATRHALRRSYWESYWFLESFNAARIQLGDTLDPGDWYRPFMHAACVTQEDLFRRELDLPPAFEADIAQVVVTAFSIYTDVVVSGADDPEREWHQYCETAGVPVMSADGAGSGT